MKIIKGFDRTSEHWQQVLGLDEKEMQYPWNFDQWNSLNKDLDVLFLLQENEDVKGFALYRLSPLEQLAHLLKIVLIPSSRGSGQAAIFMARHEDYLRNEQFERVYLEVSTTNERAVNFYRKLGFQVLRRIPRFYQDGADAWTMEKLLESSV